MVKVSTIIHCGRVHGGKHVKYRFLEKLNPHTYQWIEQEGTAEPLLTAPTIEEALRLAQRNWTYDSFRTVNCGFRYTLPERDEHGSNALFCQMVASYSSSNGVYFDEELGCNCVVHNASEESRTLWKQLMANEKAK